MFSYPYRSSGLSTVYCFAEIKERKPSDEATGSLYSEPSSNIHQKGDTSMDTHLLAEKTLPRPY